MRKTLILFVGFLTVTTTLFAGMQMTDEQMNNLDVLSAEMRKQDASFQGFNGTKDKMEVVGISEKQAKKLMDKVDIAAAKAADPKKTLRASALNKLKAAANLTDAELVALRFKKEGEA